MPRGGLCLAQMMSSNRMAMPALGQGGVMMYRVPVSFFSDQSKASVEVDSTQEPGQEAPEAQVQAEQSTTSPKPKQKKTFMKMG